MFALMPLPYPKNALAPAMSRETLETHHDKHHKTYVEKLNHLLSGSPLANDPLEDIIQKTYDDPKAHAIFNNAAQVWNHEFFWHSMMPDGGGQPDSKLAGEIASAFGSFDAFAKKFVEAGNEQFGSGYAWLIKTESGLRILTTDDAATPILWGFNPLFCCDLWEHAYYLDRKNDRKKFLEMFLEKLVNWPFANQRLSLTIQPHALARGRLSREQVAFAAKEKAWHAPHAASESIAGLKGGTLKDTAPRGHA